MKKILIVRLKTNKNNILMIRKGKVNLKPIRQNQPVAPQNVETGKGH